MPNYVHDYRLSFRVGSDNAKPTQAEINGAIARHLSSLITCSVDSGTWDTVSVCVSCKGEELPATRAQGAINEIIECLCCNTETGEMDGEDTIASRSGADFISHVSDVLSRHQLLPNTAF